MRHYELVTILSPMLNQEESVEAWGRIKEFITNRDAEIVRESGAIVADFRAETVGF